MKSYLQEFGSLAATRTERPTTFTPDPTDFDTVIGNNGHKYPSHYTPGQDWAMDQAWDILDTIKPDAIPLHLRAWLSGLIAGTLMKLKKEGFPNETV